MPSKSFPFDWKEAMELIVNSIGVVPSFTVLLFPLPPPLGVPSKVTFFNPFKPARNISVALKHFAFMRIPTGLSK